MCVTSPPLPGGWLSWLLDNQIPFWLFASFIALIVTVIISRHAIVAIRIPASLVADSGTDDDENERTCIHCHCPMIPVYNWFKRFGILNVHEHVGWHCENHQCVNTLEPIREVWERARDNHNRHRNLGDRVRNGMEPSEGNES